MSPTRIPLPRLLVALGLGLATFLVVRPALAPPAGSGELVEVVVVARPVSGGATLVAADVQAARLPAGVLPDAEPAAAPVGHTARVDLIPGEVVLAARLGPRGLAALLPAGSRALAVPARRRPRRSSPATGPTCWPAAGWSSPAPRCWPSTTAAPPSPSPSQPPLPWPRPSRPAR